MHTVAKIISDNDGNKCNQLITHLVIDSGGSNVLACSGECFELGEGLAVGESWEVNKDGINCKECLKIITFYKKLKISKTIKKYNDY